MARVQDVNKFNETAYKSTVSSMRSRGEDVHDKGKKYRDETGHLHPNVDIVGKKPRSSHNAMIPGQEPGTYILPHGISMPMLSLFDGTGSTSQWVGEFFNTAQLQFERLDGVKRRYNPQLATGVVNDVYNVRENNLPVVQVSQFESDERSAEQVRLLQPASMGNDSSVEDYDLGLYYPLSIYADFWNYYGLKGYLTLALDEIGRGFVSADGIRKYLGQSGDFNRMETDEICKALLEHWHFFLLHVPTGSGRLIGYTRDWWAERMESSRIITVEDPRILADVRAALVFVTEARHPTKQGLIEFFQAGPEHPINAYTLEKVWRIIQVAEEHFGAQSMLPSYEEIPLPNDVFAHYRHAWPIGHARQSENVTPVEVL